MCRQSNGMQAYRNEFRERLNKLQTILEGTTYLKSVFSSSWVEAVRGQIDSLTIAHHHWTPYTFFIDFAGSGGADYVGRLESALAALYGTATKHRAHDARLKALAGPKDQYLGTAFEILAVGAFAQEGLLVDYQPQVGQNVGEARVLLGSQIVLVEAATNQPEVPRRRLQVSFVNPNAGADRWEHKIREKAHQYENATEPVLLLMNVSDDRSHQVAYDIGTWADPLQREDCRSISGLAFTRDPIVPDFEVAFSRAPTHPLRHDAIAAFRSLFPATLFSRPWRKI